MTDDPSKPNPVTKSSEQSVFNASNDADSGQEVSVVESSRKLTGEKVVQFDNQTIFNRVIKRFRGRHLIFRTQLDERVRLFPRPYALVSSFRGPVWFFYGLGQIWLTHQKYHQFDGWMARVPRVGSAKLKKLVDLLEKPLSEFTHHCNESGIEGTLILEPTTVEFHWTFGYSLDQEGQKEEACGLLDVPFERLIQAFMDVKGESH
ncbi:MAG: hypothetical protein AAF623_11285 [Planctomycetota bacterium]